MPHILFMEDDTEFAFTLRSQLEGLGYDVTWVRNASEGIAIVDECTVHLVITDIFVLQNGQHVSDGGIKLISHLRLSQFKPDTKNLSNIPIIAISAAPHKLGSEYVLNNAMGAGAHAALTKPFDITRLIETIEVLLVPEPS